MIAEFLARQLGNPSGFFGRAVLAPMWNRRNAALNDAAFQSLELRNDDRVLEVGFGGGYLMGKILREIPKGFVAGIDVSEAMVAFCEHRYKAAVREGRLELTKAGAESLPYPAEYFTRVCTVNSLFYWKQPSPAFSEIWRVLKENGRLALCFTDRDSMKERKFAEHGISLYGADEARQMVLSAGFHDIEITGRSDKYRDFWCITARK